MEDNINSDPKSFHLPSSEHFYRVARAAKQQFTISILALPGDLVDAVDIASEYALGRSVVESSWGAAMRQHMAKAVKLEETKATLSDRERSFVDGAAFAGELATIFVPIGGWAKGAAMAGRGARLVSTTGEAMRFARPAVAGFTKATSAPVRGFSFFDKLAIKQAKFGMVTGFGLTTAIVTEFASGGAISRVSGHTLSKVADAVAHFSPQLAAAIKENGLSVLAFGADLYDTPRDAAVNAGATILEDNGHHDAAAALRIANVVSTPAFYADILATEPANRTERFITKVCDETGVERQQLETYLRDHPQQRTLLEEQLGAQFTHAFPELTKSLNHATDRSPNQPTQFDPSDDRSLTNAFSRVVKTRDLHLFSSLNMFLAVLCGWLGWDKVSNHFKRAVVTETMMDALPLAHNHIFQPPALARPHEPATALPDSSTHPVIKAPHPYPSP